MKHLDLSFTNCLSNGGLERLACIAGPAGVVGPAGIAGLPLTSLDMGSSGRRIEDVDLVHLCVFPLTSLSLSGCDWLTNDGLKVSKP